MNTPHPEPETLAELADTSQPVDFPADVPADVSDHVAGCDQCAREIAALRRVRETLRSLPSVTMPADVAARIESALGAEADRAEKPAIAVAGLRSGSRSGNPDRLAGRRFAHFPAAAAITVLAVVIIGTGIAAIATGRGSSKKSSGETAASLAVDKAVVLTSGDDYSKDTIRNQVAALVLGHVPGAQQYKALAPLAGDLPATGSAAGSAATAAGRSATPQAHAAASDAGGASAPAAAPMISDALTNGGQYGLAASTAPTAPGGPLATEAALRACVVALVGQPVTPLLVDYANYEGRPATIIVLPDPTIPDTLDLYVEYYTADCVKDGDVSFFATLPTS